MLLFFYVNSLFTLFAAIFFCTLRYKTVSVHGDVFVCFVSTSYYTYWQKPFIVFVRSSFFTSFLFLSPDLYVHPTRTKTGQQHKQRSSKKTNTITMHLFIVSPAAAFICICRLYSDNVYTLYNAHGHAFSKRLILGNSTEGKTATHWKNKVNVNDASKSRQHFLNRQFQTMIKRVWERNCCAFLQTTHSTR